MPLHTYNVSVHWIGNRGAGTTSYRAYGRGHLLRASGKPMIRGSSDPLFLGEADCWNPEELFVAALSSCHMLWYLHLCAQAGIVVTDYEDDARGEMSEDGENGGQFTRVELHPKVVLAAAADRERAMDLHKSAHARCFVARSVRCDVEVWPSLRV